ncbi:MAG: colanic acid biosynthesis glycosyltransferase WcaL [Rhodobacterales bacterium]|nr:MAG: colanic acid biosynthesis glycosyltransferase WcaL [Rhodobacterales bacterium]
MTGPIAYLTGEYPRATDTFIQREVFGLRNCGLKVLTCSIRKTGAEHIVGPEQRQEADQTFYILNAAKKPLHLLGCHLRSLRRAPRRYLRGLRLALKTRPAGLKALFYQLFYFAEAVVLADYMLQHQVKQLHNHIAKSSCTVAMLASEVSNIPFSFTLHGPDIFFAPDTWRLDEKIARARFVACISHFCRSQAMAFSAPEHWQKLHIVHCGVEPERYENPAPKTGKRLLFVGRLAAVKGVPVLLEALETVLHTDPDITLTLIGDGPDRQILQDQAKALGDRVQFVGYKSQSEVADYLRQTDILVLPSFAEGVPVVLMEAMAAQIPVLTTRIAGVPELVADGVSGLLVPPGDQRTLTEAIRVLTTDAPLRAKMGAAGRQTVCQHYNVKTESAWLAQLFASYQAGTPAGLRPQEEVAHD